MRVPRPLGRRSAFETPVAATQGALVAAEAGRNRARERQTEAREVIRDLGVLNHPSDLQEGQTQPVERRGGAL